MTFDPHKPPVSDEQKAAIETARSNVEELARTMGLDAIAGDAGQSNDFDEVVNSAAGISDACFALMKAVLAPIPALVGPCLRLATASPPPGPCGACTTCKATAIWEHFGPTFGMSAPLEEGFARVDGLAKKCDPS